MKTTFDKTMAGVTAMAALLLFCVSSPLVGNSQAEQTVPVKVKGEVKSPVRIKAVDPVYPEDAKKKGIEGTVILEATIDVRGAVQSVKILRSVPALDQAAINAVKQWEYEPLVIDGQPTPAVFTVTVRFMLDKEKKPTQGVSGGVAGGVEGGVTGGVQGGVKGGVQGGVKGGVEGGTSIAGAVKATGAIEPPKLIKSVLPIYPEDARKSGIEGSVILEATVDVTGAVRNVKILRSIPALDQAAIDAVKQWVYAPKIIDGKPTPVIFTVTVRFTLKDKEERP